MVLPPGPCRSVGNDGAAARFVEEVDFDDMRMAPCEITLAELLKQADYHTVHIGKWHLGRADGMAPHDQGFHWGIP